jgi:hypothetical protein
MPYLNRRKENGPNMNEELLAFFRTWSNNGRSSDTMRISDKMIGVTKVATILTT